jgi:hypothetical protein
MLDHISLPLDQPWHHAIVCVYPHVFAHQAKNSSSPLSRILMSESTHQWVLGSEMCMRQAGQPVIVEIRGASFDRMLCLTYIQQANINMTMERYKHSPLAMYYGNARKLIVDL